MKRYGMVVEVKPEKLGEYKQLHRAVWPGVLKTITECNIRNYSIYLLGNTLYAYFEYIGTDYKADMARMAADPVTQKWWEETTPCQRPIATAKPGEWWSEMEEVFHID
jgi:L-rhamnose mutarotase